MATWLMHPAYTDYEISDLGWVRRLTPARGTRPGKVLRQGINHGGYRHVNIGGGSRRVHLLVLETFYGPRPKGMVGCHGDGDRLNNKASNLRWDTGSSNYDDARRHGTALVGEKAPWARLSEKDAMKIKRDYAAGLATQVALAKKYRIHKVHVSRICRGLRWSHLTP